MFKGVDTFVKLFQCIFQFFCFLMERVEERCKGTSEVFNLLWVEEDIASNHMLLTASDDLSCSTSDFSPMGKAHYSTNMEADQCICPDIHSLLSGRYITTAQRYAFPV